MNPFRPRYATVLGCSLIMFAAFMWVPAAQAAARYSKVGLIGCAHKLETRPKAYLLACGDGTVGLIDVRWKAFGGAVARGAGTLAVDDCEPSCAAGKASKTRVSIVANAPRKIAGHLSYTRVKLIRSGGKSAGRYGVDELGPYALLEG